MTCIVGIKENNKIYMGGDSAITGLYSQNIIKEHKVFVIDDYIIGFAGHPRGIQLLKHQAWIPPYRDCDYSSVMEYMCTSFVGCLKDLYKMNSYSEVNNNQEGHGDSILVGFMDELYEISCNYEVLVYDSDFSVIGGGKKYAEGALIILNGLDISPEEKIQSALSVSEYYSTGVKEPFIIKNIG